MAVLFLLVTFNLILATSAQISSTSPPPPSGCTTELVAFSPCLTYVSLPPNNLTETVPSQCCDAVSSAFDSGDGNCLCYLIRQPLIFGFPLNETRLDSLSSACNTNGSLESICSSGSLGLPPLRSTTGSEISKPLDSEPAAASAPSRSITPKPGSNSSPTLSLPAADGARSPAVLSSPVKPASGSYPTKPIFSSIGWLLPAILIFLVFFHM
ncbi:hypothetical protein WN943_028842 [Citrus x changshan-huyou]|uniref:AAI domain-containing protein n=1 Tax=Citrus sinensis TaxID=2711 RepID=A0ACB8I5Y3_CITSI|nr:AAI domain-containing protein [Citrus sinensis]